MVIAMTIQVTMEGGKLFVNNEDIGVSVPNKMAALRSMRKCPKHNETILLGNIHVVGNDVIYVPDDSCHNMVTAIIRTNGIIEACGSTPQRTYAGH